MTQTTQRIESIDQFRGFAILLMVLADYTGHINTIPAWLKHTPDIGFTIIDLIAPMFMFAIGLTYGLSFRKRYARDGGWNTYEHFIVRYMALVGIGFLLTLGGNLTDVYPTSTNWGLLQAIGTAGLLTVLVIRLPSLFRWILGLGLLVGYQILLDRTWLDAVLAAPHGGLQGALSWSAQLILATAMADLFHDPQRGRKAYPWVSLGVLLTGIALSFFIPCSKNRVSASYILITLGASGIAFWLFYQIVDRMKRHIPALTEWGKNALLLYLLHGVLIGVFVLPGIAAWYAEAAIWLVILQATGLVVALSLIGRYLDVKGWYFSL